MWPLKNRIKNIFVTGPPGSGKSSLLIDISKELLSKKIRVKGILCPEIRKAGRRWGFKIKVFPEGKEYLIASVDIKSPYKVSKYGVAVDIIDVVAEEVLQRLLEDPNIDVVLVDEIGKMELLSQKFRSAIKRLLDSEKIVLGVLGRINDPLVQNIKYRSDTKIFTLERGISKESRMKIKKEILDIVLIALSFAKGNKEFN